MHVGIASTAFTARDMNLQVTVVADCCHEFPEQPEFSVDEVLAQMYCVVTMDDVAASLGAHVAWVRVPVCAWL